MRTPYKLDDVLRSIAFELRQPLSTIVMEAGFLSRGEQDPGRSVAESAALIRQAAHRMNRVIRDSLDWRIESGRMSVEEAQLPKLAKVLGVIARDHQIAPTTVVLEERALSTRDAD